MRAEDLTPLERAGLAGIRLARAWVDFLAALDALEAHNREASAHA